MSSFVLCVGCGTPLYGFSPCQWCTCERCGVDLRNGICPLCNSMNSCAYDPNPNSFDCPPDSYHPPHLTYETYSGDTCGNDSQFGYDCPPRFPLNYEPEPGYTQNYNSCPHDSPSFPQQYPCCDNCGELSTTITKLKEQLTSLTSFCEIAYQIVQKKHEEKRIKEEQAAKAQNQKLPVCYDDDDDDDDEEESNSLKDNIISELPQCSAVTPSEPIDSLSMRDEHLDTILATESDEFIKSCVENLVPNPSESEGENGCDVPSCFTTFSNILFYADYDFESVDDQSLHNEYVSEKIFSNPLFEEEITSIRIDQHHFNAESDLVESMLNRDSSIISSSSKINSLLDEFRLLYDNSSPRLPEEFVYENSDADFESFSPSPIPIEDSDSHMKEIDLSFNLDDPMPPSIKDDDNDSERDNLFLERLLHDDPIPLSNTLDFSNVVRVFLPFFTYPVTSSIILPSGSEDTIFDPGITINHFFV
nr:hypothetical protein [Tanacetum cinerariifolium]